MKTETHDKRTKRHPLVPLKAYDRIEYGPPAGPVARIILELRLWATAHGKLAADKELTTNHRRKVHRHKARQMNKAANLLTELAAKDAEIERVKSDLILSRKLNDWVRVNHPHIADAAILACLEQPK